MVRIGSRSASADSAPGAEEQDMAAPPAAIGATEPTPVAKAALGSLADLPIAGLTRRRVALILGSLVAAWVLLLFARQVGEAGDATARAAAMRDANEQLTAQTRALQSELALIQRQAYITQAAREYRLGTAKEIPFQLDENAPALPDDAPGSASVKLGTDAVKPTPLDQWGRLLFGPGPEDAAGS